MVLVDHEIAQLSKGEDGLIAGFDSTCLTNVGYDLRTEYFVVNEKQQFKVSIMPGESVFVASKEAIKLPDTLLGRVSLKNSRIRQGLSLESPIYQPGHFTKVFFRLTNVSNKEITLLCDEKYAMISFEKLSQTPDNPYNGTFQQEIDFRGLADYKNIYEKQISEIERKTEDLKNLEHTIYANVLVILTIFVALFTFLTTNSGMFSREVATIEFLIDNFVMLGSISFLIAVLQTTINLRKNNRRGKVIIWLMTFAFFAVALFLFRLSILSQ